jgi:thiol-disulfide isomerase/thioredoxin
VSGRRPRTRVGALAAVIVALLATACSPQDGDAAAGTRVDAAAVAATPLAGAPAPASAAAIEAAGLTPCPDSQPAPGEVADGLPDLTLGCLGDGPEVHLAGLRGAPLVLNVWASWCGPCRDELPVLAQVSAQAGDRVRFLGVDTADFDPDSALGLLQAAGVRYPSVVDYSSLTKPALRWTGPPMTVFVRADGSIAYRAPMPMESADQLRGLISQYLGVTL